MPLYPIIRRGRNLRGPHNLINRSGRDRDSRWSGGKPVGSYKYLHPTAKIPATQSTQQNSGPGRSHQKDPRPFDDGSIIDPPALEVWIKTENPQTLTRTNFSPGLGASPNRRGLPHRRGAASSALSPIEQHRPAAKAPGLPPDEELLLRNPFRKRTWNFTIQCKLAKYRPDLAKRLKLLASSE